MGVGKKFEPLLLHRVTQSMRRIRFYSFFLALVTNTSDILLDDKGRNRRRHERKKTGRGGEGSRNRVEDEKKVREERKKSFIPCDDKGLSQSRLIACSSPLRPSTRPSAVATNFDSCLAYPSSRRPTPFRRPTSAQECSTLLRPNFPSFDISLLLPSRP